MSPFYFTLSILRFSRCSLLKENREILVVFCEFMTRFISPENYLEYWVWTAQKAMTDVIETKKKSATFQDFLAWAKRDFFVLLHARFKLARLEAEPLLPLLRWASACPEHDAARLAAYASNEGSSRRKGLFLAVFGRRRQKNWTLQLNVVEILCAIPRIPLALEAFLPTQPLAQFEPKVGSQRPTVFIWR